MNAALCISSRRSGIVIGEWRRREMSAAPTKEEEKFVWSVVLGVVQPKEEVRGGGAAVVRGGE